MKQMVQSDKGLPTATKVVIEGKKLSNYYLRKFVKNMQAQKMDAESIIKAVFILDELVEKGKVTQEMLSNLEDKDGN